MCGTGSKSKAQKKKDDQAREREEAAKKKAEAKRLAEQEEAQMASIRKRAVQVQSKRSTPQPKVGCSC